MIIVIFLPTNMKNLSTFKVIFSFPHQSFVVFLKQLLYVAC